MDPLAANPLHFKPCLGFYCLQLHAAFLKLVFFFLSRRPLARWSFLETNLHGLPWKHGQSNKWNLAGSHELSRWKSYLKKWLLNFLITKKSAVCVNWNESCGAVYGRINGSRYNFKYIQYVQAIIALSWSFLLWPLRLHFNILLTLLWFNTKFSFYCFQSFS